MAIDYVGNALSAKRLAGERWYMCDRCGFLFPASDTTIEPETGLRVCVVGPHCKDVYPNDKEPLMTVDSLVFRLEEENTEESYA